MGGEACDEVVFGAEPLLVASRAVSGRLLTSRRSRGPVL